jgi:TolB-like protein
MKRIRRALSVFSLALLFGCASAPLSQAQSAPPRGLDLDTALSEGADYLASRIAARSKVSVASIQAPAPNVSNYAIDSLTMHLVNKNSFVVIERSELALLQREQRYQLSGEVSDETAVSIGKQLGAQFIITGSILPLEDKYSFRIKIIAVETAQITGVKIFQISNTAAITALIPPSPPTEKPPENRPQTVIQGDVNITNNNTTTINGDVYINKPEGFGW